jgi:hypothetical protein
MTKSPEEVDPEKAPGVAALQAMKFEEDDPNGGLNCMKGSLFQSHQCSTSFHVI